MTYTIKDVAREAGVTPGTVSRAFNGYSINENTKQRILEAAQKLNYIPNANARSLSMKNSPNIGMIIAFDSSVNAKDDFTMKEIRGAYRYAAKHKLEIVMLFTDSELQKEKTFETFCVQHGVTGVIVGGIAVNEPYYQEILNSDIPCTLIDIRMERERLGYVSVDNRKAMQEMTQYVIDKGHRNIQVIAGKKDTTVNEDRIYGVKKACRANGIPLEESDVAYCNFHEEIAYDYTVRYLQEHGKNGATCFVCFSDLMAFGVMRAVAKCGYRVPEDFSVTGFDDHPLSSYMNPPLTTVAQDFDAIGYQSVRLLYRMMKNQETSHYKSAPYLLTERESVGERK